MIPITDLSWQGLSWQTLVSNAIRDAQSLGLALGLTLDEVETEFPLNVPLPYLSRIEHRNPSDPLLMQVLATPSELIESQTATSSPLQEEHFKKNFGLIQKYKGRVLVITTGSCAIHCRYCFRRHFPYAETQPSTNDWHQLIDELKADTSITEVILSGGDPLMLSDRRLTSIMEQIALVPHISTLRFHTRLPVVVPPRVTDGLLKTFAGSRLNIIMVNHVNHGQEIDNHVETALRALQAVGVTLLNQSVLLKGINDDASVLTNLSRRLNDCGVIPYYLHLMDDVIGASHFNVNEQTGKTIIKELRQHLPGYLVPRLAREVPFETSKRVIA